VPINSVIAIVQAILERGGTVKISGKDIIIEVKEPKSINKVLPEPGDIREIPAPRDPIENSRVAPQDDKSRTDF